MAAAVGGGRGARPARAADDDVGTGRCVRAWSRRDLRSLPHAAPWEPGQPIVEGPARRRVALQRRARTAQRVAGGRDPLLDLQSVEDSAVPLRAFATPQLSFDAQSFNGVVPPDPVGDVGPEHYVHATNGPDGTPVTIYDKTTGAVAAGPFLMQTLGAGTGACATGGGDPVVLYDHLASRWLLSEFAATDNHLCVYLSRTSNPVSGGWLAYDFAVPRFPDYPKYAVWPDGYYVTTNDVLPTVYALDRNGVLAGLSAGSQRFRADALDGFNSQSLTPADLDGAIAPPAGTPAFFVRHRDDEVTDAGANNATRDFIDVWQLQADFTVPSRRRSPSRRACPCRSSTRRCAA